MYAMCGKLIAHDGQRDRLVEVLTRAAQLVGELPGCRQYLVNEDLADERAVWVYEVWEDQAAHDASLQDEEVQALIASGRPLICAPPEGAELKLVGGYGLER